MPFDFSITVKGKPAQFIPQGGKAGEPLKVKPSDTVSWNNTTSEPHQPWPTKPDGTPLPDNQVKGTPNYLSDQIPANKPSSPGWVAVKSTVTGNTIFYCCKLHPQERGTIVVADGATS